MPETSAFMAESDEERLVGLILNAGCRMVSGLPRDTPHATEITSMERFREDRAATRLFFVVSSAWQVSPLVLDHVEHGGSRRFFVSQRQGGPTIDLLLSVRKQRDDGCRFVSEGLVAYFPSFWNPTTATNERPAIALKSMYRRLVRELRRGATEVVSGTRCTIVAEGARSLIETGYILGSPAN